MQIIWASLFCVCVVALQIGEKANHIGRLRRALIQSASLQPSSEVPVPIQIAQAVVEEGGPRVSAACQAEVTDIATTEDEIKVAAAEMCEKKTGLKESAVASLQKADKGQAVAHVAASIRECELSPACADEVAPHMVLQMRLSGEALEHACHRAAEELGRARPADVGTVDCERGVTDSMVERLGLSDVEGAVSAAESGLRSCLDVPSPCDFQLAPALLVGLLNATVQEHQEQVAQAQAEQLQESPEPVQPNIADTLLVGIRASPAAQIAPRR